MGSDVKYLDETEIAKKLGIDRHSFHREIKIQIILDHQEVLSKHGISNPDIGLDSEDCIVFRDSRNHRTRIGTKTPSIFVCRWK